MPGMRRRFLAALLAFKAGDFEFRYPADLVVLQDYVYSETSPHVVVLRHKDAESGDSRSIEINMLRSLRRRLSCADYALCRSVDGIVIGTDSQDPEFKKDFETVTSTFRYQGEGL